MNTVGMAENSGGAVLLAAGTGEGRHHRGSVIVVRHEGSREPASRLCPGVPVTTYTDFWKRHARPPAAAALVPDKIYVLDGGTGFGIRPGGSGVDP